MGYDADVADVHTELFMEFGGAATLATRDGQVIACRAVLDEVTRNVGELGGQVDARPSVTLMVSEVGARPRGELTVGQRQFELERNVDGDNDAHIVRVYVRQLPAA